MSNQEMDYLTLKGEDMKIVMKEEKYVVTEYGIYLLHYELLEFPCEEERIGNCYGILIQQRKEEREELFDECQVEGVTENLGQAMRLFIQMVKGLVMPATLPDIVDDWITEKEFSVR